MQAHTIVSRIAGPMHTVEDQDASEQTAEDRLTELELDALWRNERPFGRDSRHAHIPFVPARYKFDDFGQLINPDQHAQRVSSSPTDGDNIGSWYSSLQRSASSTPARIATPLAPAMTQATTTSKATFAKTKVTRNDWFIQKVLRASEPAPSTPPNPATLSDMLEREPPGPSGAFQPPVWTVIGPGNRGFGLLQRHGWEEGSALGAAAGPSRPRRQAPRAVPPRSVEVIDLTMDDEDEAVDLTREDVSDDSEAELTASGDDAASSEPQQVEPKLEPDTEPARLDAEEGHGTALLVPLSAFLKPNKHGIGVQGEDRRKLRLKSTAQAIAATTRAGEKKHKQIIAGAQKRRQEVGRGARGFARMGKSESVQRQDMMAYLHS